MDQYDDKTIRCPRVGGEVNFRFCRFENNMLPCRWIVGCWEMRMDMNKFMTDHYSKEEMDRIFTPPKPKIESLLNLVEKAKKVKQEDD
ncbi:MAG: hypothetical protein DRG66_06150 [Deltaproteobacteria bacterium]|nr:MAG: hypothetical protein DRG66_06150 [Deltaproteobacteria bacterium]